MKLYVRGSFNEKKLWAILDFCTWTILFSSCRGCTLPVLQILYPTRPVEAVPYPSCRGCILPVLQRLYPTRPVDALPYPSCRGCILPVLQRLYPTRCIKKYIKNPLNYFSFKEKNFKVMVSKMRVLVGKNLEGMGASNPLPPPS